MFRSIALIGIGISTKYIYDKYLSNILTDFKNFRNQKYEDDFINV